MLSFVAARSLVGLKLRHATRPSTAELVTLPLHAKAVGLVDFRAILDVATPVRRSCMKALYHDLFYAPIDVPYPKGRFCTLLPQHVQTLLKAVRASSLSLEARNSTKRVRFSL